MGWAIPGMLRGYSLGLYAGTFVVVVAYCLFGYAGDVADGDGALTQLAAAELFSTFLVYGLCLFYAEWVLRRTADGGVWKNRAAKKGK